MRDHSAWISLAIVLLGGVLIWIMLLKSALNRLSIPALIGFLATGILIRWVSETYAPIPENILGLFSFFGKIGLITILFKVGLESNLKELLEQIRRASVVWAFNMVLSGVAGFATAYYLLGIHWIPSLFVAAAFTATSVGISVNVWDEMKIMDTKDGRLLLDVAEMDDISAIFIMALLFSIAPVLQETGSASLIRLIPMELGIVILKFAGFVAFCYLFAHYVEERLTGFLRNMETPPDLMIIVMAFGFLVAAVTALMGLSLAIGAFFAGLLFSRDPECVKLESSFIPIYELFSPFFLIAVGLDMNPAVMVSGLGVGVILLAAAVIGKVIPNALPVYFISGLGSAALIGISMIPRAEITMVIMQTGLDMGKWAVPPVIFSAMVFVSAGTCLLAPVGVKAVLGKYRPEAGD